MPQWHILDPFKKNQGQRRLLLTPILSSHSDILILMIEETEIQKSLVIFFKVKWLVRGTVDICSYLV